MPHPAVGCCSYPSPPPTHPPGVAPWGDKRWEAQDAGPRWLRRISKGYFNKLRLCIHRKALNSLTWDIWVSLIRDNLGTTLVIQWLRICLPMQGTRVWSLVWELRSHLPRGNQATTTKSKYHNYKSLHALEPACVPQLLSPSAQEPMICNKRSQQSEAYTHHSHGELPLARESPHSPQPGRAPTHHSQGEPPLTTVRESPHSPQPGRAPTHHSQGESPTHHSQGEPLQSNKDWGLQRRSSPAKNKQKLKEKQ